MPNVFSFIGHAGCFFGNIGEYNQAARNSNIHEPVKIQRDTVSTCHFVKPYIQLMSVAYGLKYVSTSELIFISMCGIKLLSYAMVYPIVGSMWFKMRPEW